MGRYNSYSVNYFDIAMGDESLPQVLKDLAQRIIPEKRFDEFQALVGEGKITAGMGAGNQPLLSPLSQILAVPDAAPWLKILFEKDATATLDVKVSGWDYYNTTNTDVRGYGGQEIIQQPLIAAMASRGDTPVRSIGSAFPQALGTEVPDPANNYAKTPLFHRILSSNNDFNIQTLDMLEAAAGSADFLNIKNARGETLFHRIAASSTTESDRLDAASWMLQRKPNLVNDPDRFGWTALDRMVARGQGVDNAMGRLLLASGGKLEKQIAPGFNFAAELEKHIDKPKLDKPAPRKLTVASAAL